MELLNMVSVNQESSGTLPAAAKNKHISLSTNRQFGNCGLNLLFCLKKCYWNSFFEDGGRFRYFRLRQRTSVYQCN